MARMYDAVNPKGIAASVPAPEYAAAYIDGKFSDMAAMVARFPGAIHVSITAISLSAASASAQVCDCETGDYTPAMAASWAKARIAAGFVPTIYCSYGSQGENWATVIDACRNVGVTTVDWWIAAYPGNGAALYAGSVAHQWIDHGTYDESVVADGWQPGRRIAPAPTPAPKPAPPAPKPYPISFEGKPMTVISVPIFTTDAAGWSAQGVALPAGKTNEDIVSVVCDAASAFDKQSWHFCSGAPDYDRTGVIVFKSAAPNDAFTARVFVAD